MSGWKNAITPCFIVIAVLTAGLYWFKTEAIENDLSDKAKTTLETDYAWARITADGRDLTLNGVAPSDDAAAAGLRAVKSIRGVRIASDNTEPLPVVSPYTLSATKNENGITLSGFVPGDTIRKTLIETTKAATNGEVTDELSLAAGAAPGFEVLSVFAINKLAFMNSAKADIKDNTLDISGDAAGFDQHDELIAELDGTLPGDGKLGDVSVLPPVADPFKWSAALEDSSVKLSGFVPSEIARNILVGKITTALEGVRIEDTMRVARGAPKDITSITQTAISLLSGFKNGGVGIKQDDFFIYGETKSSKAYEATIDALENLPSNLKLGSSDIKAPHTDPFGWKLRRFANGVEISGNVENASEKNRMVEMAKSLLGVSSVTDSQEFASGKPEGFDERRRNAVEAFSGLETGILDLAENAVTIAGRAASPEVATKIRSDLAQIPGLESNLRGITFPEPEPVIEVQPEPTPEPEPEPVVEAQPEPTPEPEPEPVVEAQPEPTPEPEPEPVEEEVAVVKETTVVEEPAEPLTEEEASCQEQFDETLATGSIQFEVNRAVIKSQSQQILETLANAVIECAEIRIEIAGHTDSDGAENYNQKLSEGRAEAVRVYLVNSGIPSQQLDAAGYGETRPIADNGSDEGKAQNRRIEFTVKK